MASDSVRGFGAGLEIRKGGSLVETSLAVAKVLRLDLDHRV